MDIARALASSKQTVWIGVDGGASGFRAHEIVVRESSSGPKLALSENSAAEIVEPVDGFVPRAADVQREEARAAKLELSREEHALQGRWIHAASRAIRRVAVQSGRDTARVGLCAPGLKTADGRGIEFSLHGPRVPDFIDALEQSLALDGLNLGEPIRRVVSDGIACAFGEELADGGHFGDVRDAYYVGGGSGVAEAFKLDGKIVGLDALAPRIAKAWELRASDGRTFEEHLSASGLNRDFGLADGRVDKGAPSPEAAAAAGDPRALALFAGRAQQLAELCAARLVDVHRERGIVLERIVLGQRLGQFFLDPRLETCFAGPARDALRARLLERAPQAVLDAWIANGELVPRRLVGSPLCAAAALGALALELAAD